MWGVAGLVGPTASGAAMDALGPIGLPLVLAVLFAGLTLAFWRRRRPLDSPAPIA
jgi:predicted branched-subunit amino acid permease